MSAGRKIAVRLRSPFQALLCPSNVQKSSFLCTSASPYPIQLGEAVSTPQISHPSLLALQSLFWVHALSLVPQPVCQQVIPTLLPRLASSHFLTDMSCSHHLPLAISFPSPLRKSVSPHPPHPPSLPCQPHSFPFLHSLSSVLVNIPRPGPLSLCCFSSLSFSLSQFLYRIPWGSSPKCLSLSAHLLPSAFQSTFSRLLTPLTGGQRMPQGAQISRRCKLQCFFSNPSKIWTDYH